MTNFYQYDKPIRVDASTLVLFRANQDASNYSLGQKNIWTITKNGTNDVLFRVFNDHIQYIFNQEGIYDVKVESFDKYGNLSVKQFDGFIKVKTIIPPPVNIIAPNTDVSVAPVPPSVDSNIKFGYLYNQYAISDPNFAPVGWHVPTLEEYENLLTYLDPGYLPFNEDADQGESTIAGEVLKSSGTTYWADGNTGINTTQMSFRGNAYRDIVGNFSSLLYECYTWTNSTFEYSYDPGIFYPLYFYLDCYTNYAYIYTWDYIVGLSVRLVKDDNVNPGYLTDVDGNVYNTVDINNQIWLKENWACTKLNDGLTSIPNITDNTAWSNLSTPGLCAYDNNIYNVFIDPGDVSVLINTPVLLTLSHDSISIRSTILAEGQSSITERGICYNINPGPTVDDNKIIDPLTGIGVYDLSINSLTSLTDYYIKTYCINSEGTFYSDQELSVTTNISVRFDVTPVDSNVILNSVSGVNNDGVVLFDISVGTYYYSIEKIGYITESDTILFDSDVSLAASLEERKLISFGYNAEGQLGMGNTTNYNGAIQYPNIVDVSNFSSTANMSTVFLILNDGSVKSFGQNYTGQLGMNNTTDYSGAIQTPPLQNVKQVVCNGTTTIVLLNDGSIRSFGANNYGLLGMGNLTNYGTAIQSPSLGNVKSIAAGRYHAFVVLDDNTVKSFGNNLYGQLGMGNNTNYNGAIQTPSFSNVKSVACGDSFTMIVLNDGSVRSCGINNYGQLGKGDVVDYNDVVVDLSIGNVKSAHCTLQVCWLVLNDGSVRSFGNNQYGTLGVEDTLSKNGAIQTPHVTDVSTVSLVNTSCFMLLNDGSLKCCGLNTAGQLGMGNTTDYGANIQTTSFTNISKFFITANSGCILKN